MVLWSYLTVPEFEYSGTCKLNGTLVLPKIPKMTDPARIQRQFESAWAGHWNAVKKHVSSMFGRVGCKGTCLLRCGVRCVGVCCFPCTIVRHNGRHSDNNTWQEQCREWALQVYLLAGGGSSGAGTGADVEGRGVDTQWRLDSVYDFENTRKPYEQKNELLQDKTPNKPKIPIAVQSEGDAVRALLRRGLRKYEWEGYGYLMLAVLVNVPWIIIRSAVSGQINYQ